MTKSTTNVQDLLQKLSESIASANSSVQAAEKIMQMLASELGVESDSLTVRMEEIVSKQRETHIYDDDEKKIIEGVFDGQNMIDPEDNTYPVPANYASKSKLIEGDGLKLMIQPNGAFIYKQISPTARKLITGPLVLDGSQYQVLSEGKTYNVLYASVTFFRAHVGDEVTIVVPADKPSRWAAIENVLPEGGAEAEDGE